MSADWQSAFEQPGSCYRGKPFWAWNGELSPEALRRQIRLMKRMGLGGFFMHSRVGLDTDYLGEDWFACVRACVDEAEKQEMIAWMYDEDRWPSGAAGGLVTQDPAYRQRHLAMHLVDDAKQIGSLENRLAVFVAVVEDVVARDVKHVPTDGPYPALGEGERYIVFCKQLAGCSDWYNGQTYLDTLNPEAVDRFIEVTHEAYRREIGDAFGDVVPGIFTDEPNRGAMGGDMPWSGEQGILFPWTDRLPAVFAERYGYDLLERLPAVFFQVDGEAMSPVRWHYHDCVCHLFTDAFARRVGAWCEREGIEHTGHVLNEPTMSSQTQVVGSAMRFYQYMQAPGMDLLTEHHREYDTAKGVSSVARQFGRQWRLTETYGCTGWDFPFAGHKALGDWQVALGINHRCQHLSWYTMQGQAKRDYPAGIFYQSPWWESYGYVEDYFARIHAVMTRGEEIRDVLVLWPQESVWAMWTWKGADARTRAMDAAMIALRDELLQHQIDFDYGDESILAEYGRVDGETFRVNLASYKVVVVPAMLTMRRTTLALLEAYVASGGRVVFVGEPASRVEMQADTGVLELAGRCTRVDASFDGLIGAVEDRGRRVRIVDERGESVWQSLYLLREDDQAVYLFVCNTGHVEKPAASNQDPTMVRDRRCGFEQATIAIQCSAKGRPVELDPTTGRRFAADAEKTDTGWTIRGPLPALGSRLIVIPKKASRKQLPAIASIEAGKTQRIGSEQWDYQLSEPNVLVLDKPTYRVDGGPVTESADVLEADRQIRNQLGIAERGGQMAQPWTREQPEQPSRHRVELLYEFECRQWPAGPVQLAMECPHRFTIKFNGEPVNTDMVDGWWVDRSLQCLPLDARLIRKGVNRLEMVCDYDVNFSGLELVYLLGRFGVKVHGDKAVMTELPPQLKLGDWVKQGLAFYSGNVAYSCRIRPKFDAGQRVLLSVPDWRGVAVRVLVDGRQAGHIAWAPYELDITDYLNTGHSARLAIDILGSRRNSHGPFHLNEKWPHWTGPHQFNYDPKTWVARYQLVPGGLMGPVSLRIG